MKNIGILTWHKTVNHGAVLQAYALQEVLKSKGMNVIELDYYRDTKKYNYTKIDRIKTIFKNLNLNKIKINQHLLYTKIHYYTLFFHKFLINLLRFVIL